MIVSRAPVRFSLGGGGSDLPSYYQRYGGFVVSAAIDHYVYVTANRRFYDSIRLAYSETEITPDVASIQQLYGVRAADAFDANGANTTPNAADAALNDQKKYDARRRAAHAIGCADGESVGVVLRHHRDSGWQNGPHPFGRIDVAPTEQRRHTDDAVAAHLRRR